nr:hypothetical protein [Bacteroidaceae bacterium]
MLSKDILQEIDWTKFGKYMMDVPFEVIRRSLYTSDELFKEFDSSNPSTFQDCFDTRVYNYMMEKGKLTNDHLECSARSMHDCTMRQCLRDFLGKFEQNHVVGIMGGHAMLRTDEAYAKTVFVSKKLTELGYLMISGGGPGAMEATHLGAWLAGRTEDEVKEALEIVGKAPSFKDELWMSTSFECKSCFPRLGEYE